MPVNTPCQSVTGFKHTYWDLLDIANVIPIRTLGGTVRLSQRHTSSDYPRTEMSGVRWDINGTIIAMPVVDAW
jgi:hypothetical protein